MADKKVTGEGTIERTSAGVLVRVKGKPYLLDQPSVEIENPEVSEEKRIYRKLFKHRKIYLPNERSEAEAYLAGNDVIKIGMTGYSSISNQQHADWGLQKGAYERACEGLLTQVTRFIREKFEGAQVKLTDGASSLGVDLAVIRTGRALNLERLGHSCPKFMVYVEDDPNDRTPIYVAQTQAKYSETFVRNTDLLLSVGGRMQALEHDITAGIRLGWMGKRVVPINLLGAICSHGGPQAWDAEGKVQDATAAFTSTVRPMPMNGSNYDGGGLFDLIVDHVSSVSADLCRQKLSPSRAYGAST